MKEAFNKADFNSLRQKFITHLDLVHYNSNETRIIYLDKTFLPSKNILSGTINKGYGGNETSLVEVNNNRPKEVARISSDRFNARPFYFLLNFAPAHNCIIFIVEKFGQWATKGMFEDTFIDFYNRAYSSKDMDCRFDALSIPSLFKDYIANGNIKAMKFKKKLLDDRYLTLLNSETQKRPLAYEVEITIKAKKDGFNGLRNQIIGEGQSYLDLLTINNLEFDEVIADVVRHRSKKALNISNPQSIAASFDITDEIKLIESTKQPDFAQMDEVTKKILKEEILSQDWH